MPLSLQLNGDIEERIEALVSGMCWAEELGTSLEVYWWFFYPHIQCPFDRCFSREKLPSWVIVRGGLIESAVLVQSQADFIKKGYPTVIKSKRRFYEKDSEKWLSYLRRLRPSLEIQTQMNLIPSRGSVGIYIHNCIEPPVAHVLAEVWQNHRDATGFLLSTDCYDSSRFLRFMFKDKLYCLNTVSKPIQEKYIVDRALTFFCLCDCKCILDCTGTYLPYLAGLFANKPVIVLK